MAERRAKKTTAKQYRDSAIYLGGGIHQMGNADRSYWLGAVPTVHGFVSLYAQHDYGLLQFIQLGRQYDLTMRWTGTERGLLLTRRGLVRIARRFAADVVSGAVP